MLQFTSFSGSSDFCLLWYDHILNPDTANKRIYAFETMLMPGRKFQVRWQL